MDSTDNNETLELELTYLVKFLPEEIKQVSPKRLVDVYVPSDMSFHPRLRLRQKGDKYEVTKKLPAAGSDASQHTETTIQLTKEEFDELAEAKPRRVVKDRYEIELNGKTVEFDIFKDGLEGLAVADFEFSSNEEKDNFQVPDFCLADVTQEDFIAGGLLAGKSYQDIETILNKFNYVKISL